MATYSSPTVVTPGIPAADITAVELVLLTAMFSTDTVGDMIHLFEEQYLNDMPILEIDELRAALADDGDGRGANYARAQLSRLAPGEPHLQVDEEMPWEQILQDIVGRSATLDHIEVITSYVCTRMRHDGFGGAVTVITADHILSSTTDEMACALLDRAQYGELACAPGFGNHVLIRLAEEDVRSELDEIFRIEKDDQISRDDVTGDDIRAACIAIKAECDLSHLERDAIVDAALHARTIAGERKAEQGILP